LEEVIGHDIQTDSILQHAFLTFIVFTLFPPLLKVYTTSLRSLFNLVVK